MYKVVGNARKTDIQGEIVEVIREMDVLREMTKLFFSEGRISSSESRWEKEKPQNERAQFHNCYEAKSFCAYAALVPALHFFYNKWQYLSLALQNTEF